MPIPKPKTGETQDEFISRCMGNPTMVDEYEQDQRAAICYSAWRRAKGEKVLDWKVLSKIVEKFQIQKTKRENGSKTICNKI